MSERSRIGWEANNSTGFEPVPLEYAPTCFRLHYKGRHASYQSKQTLQTLPHQLHCETQTCITKHSNSYLRDRHSHQASAWTFAESDEACQRKTKDRVSMSEKSAHSPRRDSNLYLWDTRPSCFRLHRKSRHTLPCSNKHFRYSPTSSIVCVCVCVCVCVNEEILPSYVLLWHCVIKKFYFF